MNTFHSTEIGPKIDKLDGIKSWYEELDLDATDGPDAWRRHDLVYEWYEWCDNEYPGTTQSRDWEDIATAAGKDVDIRLLIRGHSIAGYSILLFLEACYAVDKALCGTDIEALAKVKMWHMPQEMRAYSYLLSTEMILWWATELAELENEIKSTFSSRVSVSWRVKDLSRCLAKFDVVMEGRGGIGTNIWTTMEETVTGIGPPVGVDDAIYDRVERLRSSVKILRKILERSEQGDVALNTLPLVNQNSTDPGGIRRRIPCPASPSNSEHGLSAGQTSIVSEENIMPASDVASPVRIDSLLGATPSKSSLHYLSLQLRLTMKRFKNVIIRYQTTRFLAWVVH